MREVACAQKSEREEWRKGRNKSKIKDDLYKKAQQMRKERQDVVGGKYIKVNNENI